MQFGPVLTRVIKSSLVVLPICAIAITLFPQFTTLIAIVIVIFGVAVIAGVGATLISNQRFMS